eukprot:jgi/Tetstr1/460762/TSEL_005947.t1
MCCLRSAPALPGRPLAAVPRRTQPSSCSSTSAPRRRQAPAVASAAPPNGQADAEVDGRNATLCGRRGSLASLAALASALAPAAALAAEAAGDAAGADGSGGGMLAKAGKLGGILLLADIVTGIVLGKSALDMFNRKDGSGGSSWKERLADKIMAGGEGGSPALEFEIQKSEEEWKAELSSEQYRILRLKGTERPMTGEYDSFYPKEGFFKCAGCGNPLYSAASKFSSGCGWPAFDKCYEGGVITETDTSMGMRRVEIMCARCGGHLGHVFEGERMTPTNERHCVNSVSVKFDPGARDAPEKKVL